MRQVKPKARSERNEPPPPAPIEEVVEKVEDAAIGEGVVDEDGQVEAGEVDGSTNGGAEEVIVPGLEEGAVVEGQPADDIEYVEGDAEMEVPYAVFVDGTPGFVLSPYTNQMIDVTGIDPGSVVDDPTLPEGQEGYFRIPDPNAE